MRIRTRYLLFKIIIGAAVVTFGVSLYDIFANKSAWFIPIMGTYVGLAVAALLLYIGFKPRLDDTTPVVVAEPEPVPPHDVVEEVRPTRPVNLEGAHHFRCPFCANIFALELSHLRRPHELSMDCPFCANTIRIPTKPKLAPGSVVGLEDVSPAEQALFTCENCGEFLRYTAPGQRADERARVHTCPHCGSSRVDAAVGAPA